MDVTNPESPAYCFVRYSFSGRIYTAERYLRTYYRKRSDPETLKDHEREAERTCEELIAALDEVRLLDPSVLAETWPWVFDGIDHDPGRKRYKPLPTLETSEVVSWFCRLRAMSHCRQS